jgi:hypothetical protein
MSGILWRKLFMKRLFFVLLFALTALFFSACSSSGGSGGGNGSGPIEGNVIIPSAYSTDVVYVCSDADRSNSCSDTETYVKANSDGSFTITANANSPLVAEFYATDPFPSSGASVSSLGGIKPKLVYTTPAGKNTVSAFTTMVKNKMDLDPATTVDIAADAVKIASGITDPFDAASYTDNAMAVHDVVTELVEGVLAYITTTLGQTVDASPAIVAALYDVIFQLVESIADDPDAANSDMSTLLSGVESDIEQAIEDTETALNNAGNSGNWNINTPLTHYQVDYKSSTYYMQVYQSGSLWKSWDHESVVSLKAGNKLPTPQGNPDTFDMSSFFQVISATVTSPGKVYSSERFNQKITLSTGAKVYTIIALEDSTDEFNGIEELRGDSDDISWVGSGRRAGTVSFDGTVVSALYDKINLEADGTFRWINTGYPDNVVFNEHLAFDQSGTYTKSGSGRDEHYIFTTSNGAKAVLYHHNEDDASQWYLATYTIAYSKNVLFNDIAARNVRDLLDLSHTPSTD